MPTHRTHRETTTNNIDIFLDEHSYYISGFFNIFFLFPEKSSSHPRVDNYIYVCAWCGPRELVNVFLLPEGSAGSCFVTLTLYFLVLLLVVPLLLVIFFICLRLCFSLIDYSNRCMSVMFVHYLHYNPSTP